MRRVGPGGRGVEHALLKDSMADSLGLPSLRAGGLAGADEERVDRRLGYLRSFMQSAWNAELPEAEAQDQGDVVTAVVRWLEQSDRSWLLIFDDVERLAARIARLPTGGTA